MGCLTSVAFTMRATILRGGVASDVTVPENGHFERQQDPDSGEITLIWIEGSDSPTNEDTEASEYSIDCIVNSFTNAGYRSLSATESFEDGVYQIIEYVEMSYPAGVILTRRDRVTNIRNRDGEVLYIEEEVEDNPSTVFGVMGTIPVTDPFGHKQYNTAVLKRAQIQE